jgi:hypothetical protein
MIKAIPYKTENYFNHTPPVAIVSYIIRDLQYRSIEISSKRENTIQSFVTDGRLLGIQIK